MTCIVGLVENNKVYIGGDSAGVAGLSLMKRADEKVFKKDEFIFGFTSSFRMGQLIRYKLQIPKIEQDQDIDDYIHTKFLDAVIGCFRSNNFASVENNEILGGCFLFGFKGKLYSIESDFQVGKPLSNFHAVGCGNHIALGCLYGLRFSNKQPIDKVKIALEAAEEFSAGVRGPFNIVEL